ncbi:NAD(P)-binding domain-containing protein [Gymnodinialimonas sp. 57CJ19]|uniref:NAD(P)-binding domain-containing protein n=1 Tax=Gymnodinialimonas sp. 57CJ19 TaxID=3138498 RepID=UPI00313430FE
MTRIGVVAISQMGGGIARCLDRAGVLHTARDRKAEQRQVAGLSVAVSDDVAGCDVILFVVPSTAQVAEVMADLPTRAGQVVVDLTTSHPDDSMALAAEVWAADVVFSCVYDTDQLAELIAQAPVSQTILISLSTCDPDRMAALAADARPKGITLLEAPISGTSKGLA